MLATQPTTPAPDAEATTISPPQKFLGWKQILAAVDPFLHKVAERLAAQTNEFQPDIAAYARYALTAHGKQLRPILVTLSGESTGKLAESHLTVAVIIEMVHLATLVHDDIIDEAGLRRGRATLAAKWGNQIAVLLGDCLFAKSLKLAASFPTPEICRAVASATDTVCQGEILQTQSRGSFDLSHEQYFKMLSMKTAELFSLSCDLGGCLSEATPAQRNALRQYGLALGTAYQLYDDCLDLFGSESIAGKTLAADFANGKVTLPVLTARDKATDKDQATLREWFAHWKPERLSDLLSVLGKYRALPTSRETIHNYLATAREALAALPPGDGTAGLAGLTRYLAEQTEILGV